MPGNAMHCSQLVRLAYAIFAVARYYIFIEYIVKNIIDLLTCCLRFPIFLIVCVLHAQKHAHTPTPHTRTHIHPHLHHTHVHLYTTTTTANHKHHHTVGVAINADICLCTLVRGQVGI